MEDADNKFHAFEVHGFIRDYHVSIGRGKSIVGCSVSDETAASDGRGRFSLFQNGAIYWTPQTGAHEIFGNILKRWMELGAERSWLGYPLTGEIGFAGGRMNSFERGQILWQNGIDSTRDYRGIIIDKYNGLGGIRSRLGLPTSREPPVDRVGNTFVMSFRGGNISIPLDQPAPRAISTQTVQILWMGLECQVKQESNDELAGVVSLLVPSTAQTPSTFPFPAAGNSPWQLGQKNERIMNTRQVLYEGPPANVIITTTLVELDKSAGDPMKTVNQIIDVVKDASDIVTAIGGDDIPGGYGRELDEAARKFKELQNSTVWATLRNLFDSPDDPYPAGVLELKWNDMRQRSVPKQVLRRPDDPHTITWTESITVSAKDSGGDFGQYAFYFDVNVFDSQNPL